MSETVLTIKLADNIRQVLEVNNRLRAQMPHAIARGVLALRYYATEYTIKRKMTNSGAPYHGKSHKRRREFQSIGGGKYLTQQTGNLNRWTRQFVKAERVQIDPARVRGEYGTTVDYGYKHEFGGVYTEHVPEHVVRAHQVKAHTRKDGRVVKAHVRQAHTVRAHQTSKRYRARKMFRDARTEIEPTSRLPIVRAIAFFVEHKRLPPWRQLIAGMPT